MILRILFFALVSGAAFAAEIPVTQIQPKVKDCGRGFSFKKIIIMSCGPGLSVMKVEENGKKIGESIKLGNMNVRGIRAFSEGDETLLMIDVGDEGGGSPNFYSLLGNNLRFLGSVNISNVSPDEDFLEHARYLKLGNVIEFKFDIPVGRLNRKGEIVKVPDALIRIRNNKAQLFSKGKQLP